MDDSSEPTPSRGIVSWGSYIPRGRLDLTTVAAVAGSGGALGTRSVASYDEDATTMAVEAARQSLKGVEDVRLSALWFATTAPPYLDKTNATAVHAALQLPADVGAYDAVGSVRSTMGILRNALRSFDDQILTAADVRIGLPGSADEANGGDGSAALLVAAGREDAPVLADAIGWGSVSAEFLDRWRSPSEMRSRSWEERFGETRYLNLGGEAFEAALASADSSVDDIDLLVVAGSHERVLRSFAKRSGVPAARHLKDLDGEIGNTGAAQPFLVLCDALERAMPGQRIALVTLSDGADAVIFRATEAISTYLPSSTVAAQTASARRIPYGRYLAWRRILEVEPPRRPEPARPSATASARSTDWKYGFVGSERSDGSVHLPPSPLDEAKHPMQNARGTVVTYTIDRLAYSPSPPIVFAVVDFEGGGRLPLELTDVEPREVSTGASVEMTFRRLFTADGIHNYFWKGRLARSED